MILNKMNPETVETVSALIRDGGVVVLPCDTIYGLCAANHIGEKALVDLKGRPENKPFLILATIEQAKALCVSIPQDILDTWPAPLTVVLNTKDGKKTAIRVPADPFLQKILEVSETPMYSTSVNMAGEPSLLDFTDISQRFEAFVDCVVRDKEIQGKVPSTLIDATVKPYKILREGAFDATVLVANSANVKHS